VGLFGHSAPRSPTAFAGPNLDGFWGDEITSWASAEATWDNLQMATRIRGPRGDAPCGVVSTTPKIQRLLRQIVAAPTTRVTRAKTSDNAGNLDASTLAYYQQKYGGTRLGRQELDAELLTDLEGALWSRDVIDAARVREHEVPDWLKRIVIAIDPPGGSGRGNVECGLIAAGVDHDGEYWVLADLSGRYSPEQWARRAVQAYRDYEADRIVAEQNFGGAMVESTIRAVNSDVPVRMVVASRGKAIRAEPIAALYEQHRVHHVGQFAALEDQMTGWDPAESGPSPDRVDALVSALSDLSSSASSWRTVLL
jgi:predicted phage terminase large subunit-like protein